MYRHAKDDSFLALSIIAKRNGGTIQKKTREIWGMEANFIGNAENESAVKSVGSEIFRFKGTFWKLM